MLYLNVLWVLWLICLTKIATKIHTDLVDIYNGNVIANFTKLSFTIKLGLADLYVSVC